MARWPDNPRSTLTGFLLAFVLLPLLCWLCWWYVYR
jgi:predicted Na+-dependent transporter